MPDGMLSYMILDSHAPCYHISFISFAMNIIINFRLIVFSFDIKLGGAAAAQSQQLVISDSVVFGDQQGYPQTVAIKLMRSSDERNIISH